MENFWPSQFGLNEQIPMKKMLEEQGDLLYKMTRGHVGGEVNSDMSDLVLHINGAKKPDFLYRFELVAKFLDNYRYSLFSFSHDITLYPVKFVVDPPIAAELSIPRNSFGQHSFTIEDAFKAKETLPLILRSQRVQAIVGSILKLSQ